MTTVAITGVAGHVGRRLVRALELRPDIGHVVGLDLVAPRGCGSPKLTFRQIDVRDDAFEAALRGVDVVVHLATRLPEPHDADEARSVNVDGTRNVVEAARRAGVGRFVYVSSVFAYGAHPDNDLPLTEDSELRPTVGLDVGAHQCEVERWLASSAGAEPRLDVTVLRLAMVVGPGMDNVLTRLLESPRITTVRGHRPPLQFLHLDDAVRAIVHVIDRGVVGTYNVAAEGWLSFDEVTAIASRRTVDVPEELAVSAADRLWKLGLGEHPPGIVHHLMHPWVMSPAAFVDTGWRPHATNRDALAETVQDHAGYVALGGARAERRTVLRTLVSFVGALVGWFVVRRWTRHRSGQAAARHGSVAPRGRGASAGRRRPVRTG